MHDSGADVVLTVGLVVGVGAIFGVLILWYWGGG